MVRYCVLFYIEGWDGSGVDYVICSYIYDNNGVYRDDYMGVGCQQEFVVVVVCVYKYIVYCVRVFECFNISLFVSFGDGCRVVQYVVVKFDVLFWVFVGLVLLVVGYFDIEFIFRDFLLFEQNR